MQSTKQIIKSVKKIEINTKHLVDSLLQGAYHSIFKGRGIEFSEVREYVLGDDVRTIDWNVTARMNHPFVKEFIEERDLTIYIVFDISASGEFGYQRMKKSYAVELAASLMFAALRNNDKVGLCLFTSDVERFLQARKGKRHVLMLIRELLYYSPKHKQTDLNRVLVYLSKVLKKRAIIFIISDFMTGRFYKPLKIIKRKHDIVAIRIVDPRELEIPDVGFIELEDEETGEQILVDTSDYRFRENYKSTMLKMAEELKRNLNKISIDLVEIRTDEPFDVPLRKFFKLRKKRR